MERRFCCNFHIVVQCFSNYLHSSMSDRIRRRGILQNIFYFLDTGCAVKLLKPCDFNLMVGVPSPPPSSPPPPPPSFRILLFIAGNMLCSFLVQSFKETLQYCDEWRKFTSVISHSVMQSFIVLNSGGRVPNSPDVRNSVVD